MSSHDFGEGNPQGDQPALLLRAWAQTHRNGIRELPDGDFFPRELEMVAAALEAKDAEIKALRAEAEIAKLRAALETVRVHISGHMILNALVMVKGAAPDPKDWPTLGEVIDRALGIAVEQRMTGGKE